MILDPRGTLAAIQHGAEVVVIERHSELSSCEGRVIRVTDADTVPVAIVDLKANEDGMHDGRHRLPLSYLGLMPIVGMRYRWDAGYVGRYGRTPFTVGERFEAGHQFAGLFRLLEDGSPATAIGRGHSAIASAGELAKYAVLVEEPDGAEDGTTGETRVVVANPRNGGGALDTLRDAVLEAALSWEAMRTDSREWPRSVDVAERADALADTVAAYRAARDS